ncbi:hypothetical protein GCM10027280_45630 [Micromonospora polyrhachis]|uniref:Uncharacterized protein n=1 Tax=Micromonospora polyrhachis TaxID=1282883 RepID=A0A7W7WQ56_9ACTN|nr:hypothetical protein [Micromonospora polyrhachis]MBB4958923.1 hypothetical protein [Micromonospora polyrhachis]
MRRADTARVLKPARRRPPPGHWIIASLTAGHPVAAEQQPDPDCAQCVATTSPTSQEVQP